MLKRFLFLKREEEQARKREEEQARKREEEQARKKEEERARKKEEEETREREQEEKRAMAKERKLLIKFQKILAISSRVNLKRISSSLRISEDELFEHLLDWESLPFKIEGDDIVVESTDKFILAVDDYFDTWHDHERKKKGKMPDI